MKGAATEEVLTGRVDMIYGVAEVKKVRKER
jgi:hypothetical protein